MNDTYIPGEINILVISGFGAKSRKPLINIAIEDDDWSITISTKEARAFALNLLSAAEAAINDAHMVSFLEDKIQADDEMIATFLQQYRQKREDSEL